MACWSGVAPSMRMRLSSRCHAALARARVAAKSQSVCSARRFLSALAALTAEMPQRTCTVAPSSRKASVRIGTLKVAAPPLKLFVAVASE